MLRVLHRLVPLALLVLALGLKLEEPPQVAELRLTVFDTYQRLWPREYQPAPVRVIDIDEKSLSEVGQWPWSRRTIAELVVELFRNGVAVVGLDLIFSEPDRTSPAAMAEQLAGEIDSPELAAELRALPDHDAVFAEVIGVDDFRLETVDAELIYLDFWASWCPPCRVSFPWMKQLSERYGSRGLRVIAINVDRDPVAAERFLNQARPDFDIVRDPEGQLAATYDIAAMPSSFLLTPGGEILLRHEGFRAADADALEARIAEALAQRTRPGSRPETPNE